MNFNPRLSAPSRIYMFKFFKDRHSKFIKTLEPIIKQIGDFEYVLKNLSDEQLKNKTQEFRDRLKKIRRKL